MTADHEPDLALDPSLRGVLAELVALEPLAHWPASGATRRELEERLAEDFWEIGASGRSYSREFVLGVLEARTRQRAQDGWEASGYHCRRLAPELYQLTYTHVSGKRRTRRSTLWQRTDGAWQVRFHQGTVVEDAG